MPSIAKITEIMDLLRDNYRTGLTSKEISISLKIPQSTCYRIISNLKNHGYIQQRPNDTRFTLGYSHLRYAQALLQGIDENQLIDPYLEALHIKTSRTTVYTKLSGQLCVAMEVRGAVDTRISVGIGEIMPMNCTAGGKVVLAFMPPRQREKILTKLQIEGKTPSTIRGKEELRESLNKIRKTGIAYNLGELHQGINSMASPIFDAQNNIFGAIVMVSTEEDLPMETLKGYSRDFHEVSREITENMGGEYPRWISA